MGFFPPLKNVFKMLFLSAPYLKPDCPLVCFDAFDTMRKKLHSESEEEVHELQEFKKK